MVNKPLARARLITQGVAVPLESKAPAGTPEHAQEIASYFAATQGQDFRGQFLLWRTAWALVVR